MPRRNYSSDRLTNAEVIELIASGQYLIDLELGTVTSYRTGELVYTYCGKRSPNLWVRIYKQPKFRALPVAHLVWMAGTRCEIPRGWEVHHRDTDNLNNAFLNLLCLHRLDHKKFHVPEYVAADLPF